MFRRLTFTTIPTWNDTSYLHKSSSKRPYRVIERSFVPGLHCWIYWRISIFSSVLWTWWKSRTNRRMDFFTNGKKKRKKLESMLFAFDSFSIGSRDDIPSIHIPIRTLSYAFLWRSNHSNGDQWEQMEQTCSELERELPGFWTHALKHLSDNFFEEKDNLISFAQWTLTCNNSWAFCNANCCWTDDMICCRWLGSSFCESTLIWK